MGDVCLRARPARPIQLLIVRSRVSRADNIQFCAVGCAVGIKWNNGVNHISIMQLKVSIQLNISMNTHYKSDFFIFFGIFSHFHSILWREDVLAVWSSLSSRPCCIVMVFVFIHPYFSCALGVSEG